MNREESLFFKDKKVLITGHTGFVGTWMCMVLKRYGADIAGISLPPEKKSLYREAEEELHMKSYICDLRELEPVQQLLHEIKPDIVIHLAAFGFVKECVSDPIRTFSSNVMGTVHLLEASRTVSTIKSILVVSSDKVYENKSCENKRLFTESDSLGGIDIYSSSKTCEDIVAQSYYDSYLRKSGISCNIVRPGNILGGGDYIESRLIPSLLHGFAEHKPIEIRNRNAIRPWQNIFDAIDAYLTVIYKTWNDNDSVGIYNVGPDMCDQLTVGEISDYLGKKFEYENKYTEQEMESSVKEAAYLGVSIGKISQEFGWRPRKTITDTLDEIFYFWEKSKKNNVYEICMELVDSYYKLL